MDGFINTVTNLVNGKRYIVSTVESENKFLRTRTWQTGVFKDRFGLFAGLSRPVLFAGVEEGEARGRRLHERMVTIVESIDPANWDDAKFALVKELVEEAEECRVAENQMVIEELVAKFDRTNKEKK